MVEECKDTNTQGLVGWNATPLALEEDFDSNLVNIFMLFELKIEYRQESSRVQKQSHVMLPGSTCQTSPCIVSGCLVEIYKLNI